MTSQSTSEPIVWKIMHRSVGCVDSLLLGDQDDDSYRIGMTIVTGPDGLEVDAQPVYPCAACGWALACGVGGEDCHS